MMDEAREKILILLGYKADSLDGWYIYPDGYTRKGLPDNICQILALIPELPKDKPPLLNPEERLHAEDKALEALHSQGKVVGKDGFERRDIAYTVREFIAQAQRDSDIKWYGGE